MHLKKFTMWLFEENRTLSPAYDLLNVKIILEKYKADTALLHGGEKINFSKGYIDRFWGELKLNDKQINAVYKRLKNWLPEAIQLIDMSFLTEANRNAYKELLTHRTEEFTEEM